MTHTLGGQIETPVVRVPRVRIFGRQVDDLEVAISEFPPRLGIDGIVGLNFLQHLGLRLNFREKFIEI